MLPQARTLPPEHFHLMADVLAGWVLFDASFQPFVTQ
jgi:hypothetical protein